jgi:hypothetical protein
MAANVEHLIDIEEVDQRVIERVPSVDEADLSSISRVNELGKPALRGFIAQLDDSGQAGTFDLPQSRAVPRVGMPLRRIE